MRPLLVLALVLLAVPAAAGDRAAGRGKALACQTCHGLDGIAVAPDAPNLAGQPALYLAAQLRAYRAGTRVHEQMTLVTKDLSDADIADLAAWYASIEITARMPPH